MEKSSRMAKRKNKDCNKSTLMEFTFCRIIISKMGFKKGNYTKYTQALLIIISALKIASNICMIIVQNSFYYTARSIIREERSGRYYRDHLVA